jgi:hypothetical protein
LDQPGPFELQENLHEEPRRNAVRVGDIAKLNVPQPTKHQPPPMGAVF